MTMGDVDHSPTIDDTVVALRRRIAASPQDIEAHIELAEALTRQVGADETRTPMAADADEPIELLRTAAQLAADEPAQRRAAILVDLGQQLAWRFNALLEAAGAETDSTQEEQLRKQMDDAISCLRRALGAVAEAGAVERFIDVELAAVARLAGLLRIRFFALGEVDDLSAAIEYQQQILDVLGADDEDRPGVLYQLGLDHATRHDQQTETAQDDQDRAIACLREVRGLIGDDHPGRPELAARLGCILGYRILQASPASSASQDCLEADYPEAIDELTRAREALTPAADPAVYWQVRFRLGMIHAFRYLYQGGDPQDGEVAVAELSELLDHPDSTPSQADHVHLLLAMLEMPRVLPAGFHPGRGLSVDRIGEFHGTQQDRDRIVRAVQHHLDSISESSAADPQFSWMMRGITVGLAKYAGPNNADNAASASDPELVDLMMTWLDEAIPELGEIGLTDELLAAIRSGVRASRLHQKGDRAAAASAIDQITESVAGLEEHHLLRPVILDLLGVMVGLLDAKSQSAEDSSAAITRMERILAEIPEGHPDRARALTRAGLALFKGMIMNRSAVSFDRVRAMLQKAVDHDRATGVTVSVNRFMFGMIDGHQGWLEHDIDRLDSGIDLMKKEMALVPEDHVLRSLGGPSLGMMLYARALLGGGRENFDAAEFYSRSVGRVQSDGEPKSAGLQNMMRTLGDFGSSAAKIARRRHDVDIAMLDELTEKLSASTAQMSGDDVVQQLMSPNIPMMRLVRKVYGMAAASDFDPRMVDHESLKADADAMVAALSRTPEGRIDHAIDTIGAAMALFGPAFLARDLDLFDRAISMAGKACAIPDLYPQERLSALGCLSFGLWMKYYTFRRRRDLNNAIERLEQAELLIDQNPPDGAEAAPILHLLGTCYHERADQHRRDHHRAVDAGLRALRERAHDVLLQTNSDRALDTAIATGGEAADVARWCLAAGSSASAVTALELGRAIVLHFTTIDAGIPELLRKDGYSDLATEWETESSRTSSAAQLPWNLDQGNLGQAATNRDRHARTASELITNLGQVAIPSDLRRRVLAAVEGTDTYARLLDPPPVADVSAALAATASGALAYLLPASEFQPGLAVLVHPDGTVQRLELHGLRCDPGTAFDALRQAHRALQAAEPKSAEEAKVQQDWESRLDEVCDWAWTAAMAEVLSVLGGPAGGRPARLVLVPVGELGMVPWHAARRRVPGGGLRHACQDVVISYASSARQFVDTARRRTLPWQHSPAVVRVNDGLFFASEETEEIHRLFYPEGIYLGARQARSAKHIRQHRSNRPTAARVRGLLPSKSSAGASLLHLGCHAFLANPPIDSFLQLTGKPIGSADSALYVRDILEQARDRPRDAEGGLVILAACASDLTGGAYDEALTLATAFLAAGSAGVLGAKWGVDDGPTALFMVMFHHYLNSGYRDPATALRVTQQWMLNDRRKLPERISKRLADAQLHYDLTKTANWAAFTYQGQ